MFKARVLTALVGIPVILFFIYCGGCWYGFAVSVITVIGLREYFRLMRKRPGVTVELAAYIFVVLNLWMIFRGNLSHILALWVLAFLVFCLFPVFSCSKTGYWESALSFWGIIYIGGLAGFLLAIRLLPDGLAFTILLLLMVWVEDILAYFAGSMFGKTLLASKISPKKTWEGTIAGVTGSSLTGLLLPRFFSLSSFNLPAGFLLGLMIGTAATLGDLSQSALKRTAGVKDSGKLLPGHGGVLDRFDSLFFAAPLFYFYIRYLL